MKKKSVKGIVITLGVVLGVMTMIFCFSAQVREDSNQLSESVTTILISIKRWLDSFMPKLGGGDAYVDGTYSLFDDINHYVRKLAHLSEFALLGGSLLCHIRAWASYKDKVIGIGSVILSLGVGVLYALSDEIHQLFVEQRGAELKDVFIDSVGVLIGILFIRLILLLIDKRKTKKEQSNN